jgi:hypothetical protein
LNICGEKDIWPIMAWFVTWWYGKAGRFGFASNDVTDTFYPICHDYFSSSIVKTCMIPFLTDNSVNPAGMNKVQRPHRWLAKVRFVAVVAVVLLGLLALEIYNGIKEKETIANESIEWNDVQQSAVREAREWEEGGGLAKAQAQWCEKKDDGDLRAAIDKRLRDDKNLQNAVDKLGQFYVSLGTATLDCPFCSHEYACIRWVSA